MRRATQSDNIFEAIFDNFGGEVVEADEGQLGDYSSWTRNWMILKNGTSMATREGFQSVVRFICHEIAGLKYPTLDAAYLKDLGDIPGNFFGLLSGVESDRPIAAHLQAFDDGSVLGDATTRRTQVYPPSASTGQHWPRGSEVDGVPEHIAWRGCIFGAEGHMFVFQPRQVPIYVYGSRAYALGIEPPAQAPTVATGSGGSLTGAYEYKTVLANSYLRLLSDSPPSVVSATANPSGQKVTITDANVDQYTHPSADIVTVKVYVRRVSATDTWENFMLLAEVPLATFKASGYAHTGTAGVDDDDTVKGSTGGTSILDESSNLFRGFSIAGTFSGRIIAGNEASWSGLASVTNGSATVTLYPSLTVDGVDSRYFHWIRRGREIEIAGTTRLILYAYYDTAAGLNKIVLGNDDLSASETWAGSTDTDAAALIRGDKRTLRIGYAGPGFLAYWNNDLSIPSSKIGNDTEGELTWVGACHGQCVVGYEKSIYKISGWNFPDSHTNVAIQSDLDPIPIIRGVGILSPKSVKFLRNGDLIANSGNTGGIVLYDGVSVRNLSDKKMMKRLADLGDQKFTESSLDQERGIYRLHYVTSKNDLAICLDVINGHWWEETERGVAATSTEYHAGAGAFQTDGAGEVSGVPDDPIVIDEPVIPPSPIQIGDDSDSIIPAGVPPEPDEEYRYPESAFTFSIDPNDLAGDILAQSAITVTLGGFCAMSQSDYSGGTTFPISRPDTWLTSNISSSSMRTSWKNAAGQPQTATDAYANHYLIVWRSKASPTGFVADIDVASAAKYQTFVKARKITASTNAGGGVVNLTLESALGFTNSDDGSSMETSIRYVVIPASRLCVATISHIDGWCEDFYIDNETGYPTKSPTAGLQANVILTGTVQTGSLSRVDAGWLVLVSNGSTTAANESGHAGTLLDPVQTRHSYQGMHSSVYIAAGSILNVAMDGYGHVWPGEANETLGRTIPTTYKDLQHDSGSDYPSQVVLIPPDDYWR